MRYIRYGLLALIALALVTVALANRGVVTLRLLPEGVAGFAGIDPRIDMPLFLVVLIGVALGLLTGFVWEWIREHRQRAEAARMRRALERAEEELGRLRQKPVDKPDDVLALLGEDERRKAG
ncbi:DUF1049 domain-containing protein [Rhodobacteraceae bacterium WD3A24]|nr:DUF1049 domain-containing protein [Rhodobacteraceae bacterium WD3A24]